MHPNGIRYIKDQPCALRNLFISCIIIKQKSVDTFPDHFHIIGMTLRHFSLSSLLEENIENKDNMTSNTNHIIAHFWGPWWGIHNQ
jgi:hypothetical protein